MATVSLLPFHRNKLVVCWQWIRGGGVSQELLPLFYLSKNVSRSGCLLNEEVAHCSPAHLPVLYEFGVLEEGGFLGPPLGDEVALLLHLLHQLPGEALAEHLLFLLVFHQLSRN